MRDDAGDVIGVATCALDITERKQTEDALQEARRQMQAFLDHSPALMSIFDRDGRYHLVNSATADVLGRPRKEIVGQTFADLFPPEMASTFMRRVKRIAEVQGPLVVDDQIVVGGEKRIFSTILFHLSQRDDEPMTFGSIATDVTARKEAEQALRTSERQFRSLFEEAQIGIALIDQDTRIRAANPFMCRWLGYSEEEIQRLSVSDITFPGDLQREQDLIQEMKQGKRDAVRLEKRYVRKNGEIVWGDLVTNVVQDDQGNFLFGLGTVVDITERKRAEEDLRDSQERLKLALHGGALGTWDWNVQTDEVRFNERWAEMVGYGLEELEPHLSTWENLVHPDDIPAVYEALNAHLEGKTPFYEAEFRMQHKSGEWVWVLDRGKVIERDGKGRPLRACGTHLDITERKRTEHAAQARLRIAEASATKSLEEIMQMTLNEIESLTNSEIGFYHFLMEDQETLALQTWSANTLENMCSAEGEGLHYSVSEAGVWADCIRERRPIIHNDYFSLPDRKGMPPGHTPVTRELALPIMREDRIVAVLGVGNKPTDYNERDVQIASLLADFSWEIVERKRAEAKLEHYAAELKRSNEDLEQFAYVVSHDLREPARMVKSYLELLEDRYQSQLDEKADKYIDHAVDGAERMQEMIKALLELSRIETEGKEPAPTDVEAVLERTLNVLGRAIEETQADVTHDPLPTVMADEAQLGQVFQNLIANAIKFRREDVPPRVHVSAEREGDEWVFSVADNGIGIDPEQADRLFQIFQRLHTREEYEGLGIGLALCRRVVERHGGHIWVESEPGEGTNFFFTIPVRDVPEG
jgi:PAS domain S-box-containing protein